MFVFLRILIGSIFIVSGVEKVLHPYQNFLYALQAYAFFPSNMEDWIAQVFPWLELFVGVFLFLGLWTRPAILSAVILFASFIIVVGQALWRGLDITNCGCFGQLVHISPRTTIVIDSGLLLAACLLWCFQSRANQFSLDRYFKQ